MTIDGSELFSSDSSDVNTYKLSKDLSNELAICIWGMLIDCMCSRLHSGTEIT